MKKLLFLASFVIAALSITQSVKANIVKWTFETFPNDYDATSFFLGPRWADIGGGAFTGYHDSGLTVWSHPAGNGSSNSLASDHWAIGNYLHFDVGFGDNADVITVGFDITRSATGPTNFSLQYSTNGNVSFTPVSSFMVMENGGASALPAWNSATSDSNYSFIFDLSAVSGLKNFYGAGFNLVAESAPVDNVGSVRVDNFYVETVPEPSSIAMVALGGFSVLSFSFYRRRNK